VALAALVGVAVLAPVRMVRGAPKTRFAVLPAGVPNGAGAGIRLASATTAADGPAVPLAAGPEIATPFPLSHLGLRWQGPDSAAVDIRLAGPDGAWAPWRAVAADHDLEDGTGGPVLSELVPAHGATRVQVRTGGDAHDVEVLAIDSVHGRRPLQVATAAPAGAEEDGGDARSASATASSTTSTTAKATTTTTSRPKPAVLEPPIVTRAQWGADESLRKNTPKFAPISKLFVHHTVTSPDGPDPDPAATVRAIYAYHTQGRGWDDIGYNFLIDAQGRIYEGRWARNYASGEKPTGEDLIGNGVIGAHVLDHNVGSVGVAMLGDFTNGEPTQAARDSLVAMLAWKADRHGIDVLAQDPYTSSQGNVETFPNLAGHRDAGQTECPGDALYPLLPGIRGRVAQLVTATHGPTTGYWTTTADGRVLTFGDAPAAGSMDGKPLNSPIVGMAPTPSGKGYWLLGADGGIFSFGDARFYGSTGGMRLNKPVVRMAPTPTGNGYWFVASDGGIFSFGDAHFYGSTGSMKLNRPIVGMAPTSTGKGYWLVASDGGIFAFGDARFHGSTGSMVLNSPVISMAPTPDGAGYWLVARDGGLFAFDAPYYGSIPGEQLENYPGAVQVRSTEFGKGYYIADANGGISTFGDARFLGADPSQRAPRGAVDLALKPAPKP
jgi:hypothetical protein